MIAFETMRAFVVDAPGAPFSGQMRELPRRSPGENEVLVEVKAVAASLADLMIVRGQYPRVSTPPLVPGVEAAGIVLETGAGVDGLSPGDRVMVSPDGGAFATELVLPSTRVFPKRADLSFERAAILPNTFGIALLSLRKAGLSPGETVAVRGAGGVGLATIRIARHLGAHVIAASRSAERRALALTAGADIAIDPMAGFSAAVLDANGGKGADIVVDPVGTDIDETVLDAVAWGGRLVVLGFAGGRPASLAAAAILRRSLTVIGAAWAGHLDHHPGLARRIVGEVAGWVAEGTLGLPQIRTEPLSAAAVVLARIAADEVQGRIVLVP